MFPLNSEKKSSLPGLKYPSLRDCLIKSTEVWLHSKRMDDNAEGLWRVHNDLYDLSSWTDKHPGGADWIKLTKASVIRSRWLGRTHEYIEVTTIPSK